MVLSSIPSMNTLIQHAMGSFHRVNPDVKK